LVCGFYIRGHLNWHQAEQECQEYGAELPIIKSESDNKNILSVKVFLLSTIYMSTFLTILKLSLLL